MSATTDTGIAAGVYSAEDVPAEAYHADPALSSTGARKLLDCPAKFRWEADNGQPYREEFAFGSAAHKLVLGDGPELVCVDYDNWRTQEARDERDEIHAAGGIALLPEQYDRVHAMADALRQHPVAGALFAPSDGQPEVSLFWRDDHTGVNCRARLDWLRNPRGGRLIVPDYKTAADASPAGIQKALATWGYHQQAAWYLDGVRAVGLGSEDAVFLLVVQEKEPPHVVTVAQIAPSALMFGAARNARARQRFRDCTASGIWPGYADEPITVALPTWAEIRDEEYL